MVRGSRPHVNTERIPFLMFDATGFGGVARSVNMLASHLARTHEVHGQCLFRGSDEPPYPLDARVTTQWLIDHRRSGLRRDRPRHDRLTRRRRRQLDTESSCLEPDPGVSAYAEWCCVESRPDSPRSARHHWPDALHLAVARWAPDHVVRIAQDHLKYAVRVRNDVVMAVLDEAVPRADAFVTLSEADRDDYEGRYPAARVERIPNASPVRLC